MSFDDIVHLESPTGATLAVRHAPASAPARGCVLVCHGLAEHAGRYAEFAGLLAARGYQTYAHDHRGHGHTRAPGAVPCRFAPSGGAGLVVEDVMAVRAHVAGTHPGLPIILFGHSLGGMIAAATAEAHPSAFAALAIWNADLDPGLAGRAGILLLKLERFLKGSDVPSHHAPRLTFDAWSRQVGDTRTPFAWLSRDARAVAAYAADPLCGFAPSVSMWLDVLELSTASGRPAALARLPKAMPVHLLGGGCDPATANGDAMRRLARRMQRLGMTAVHLEIHAEMRHETLHEFGRLDAMKAFVAWIDGITAAGPGQR